MLFKIKSQQYTLNDVGNSSKSIPVSYTVSTARNSALARRLAVLISSNEKHLTPHLRFLKGVDVYGRRKCLTKEYKGIVGSWYPNGLFIRSRRQRSANKNEKSERKGEDFLESPLS